MRSSARILATLASLWFALAASGQGTNTAVSLLLERSAVRPGDTFWAALRLQMQPEWHTYWRAPGDAGQATKVKWTLPPGLTAGEIHWPVPERYSEAGLVTHVYHGEVLLLVPVTIGASAAPGDVELQGRVTWLECRKECLQGVANVSAKLTIGAESVASPHQGVIQATLQKLPLQDENTTLSARWAAEPKDDERPLVIELPAGADFFAYENQDFDIAANTTTEPGAPAGRTLIRKNVVKYDGEWPASFLGLMVEQGGGGAPVSREVTVKLEAAAAVPAARSGAAMEAQPAAPVAEPLSPRGLFTMLGFALLGGLILNIMPCVLPVIALKILGFVKQSQEDPGRVRVLGLYYTAGVLVSFLALAGLVIAVKAARGGAAWGMQFQNPVFLIVMIMVVTLVALNLFGVFEVYLGGGAMSAASGLAAREGGTGAFFNGVLATVLATPCTAPFLGVSLGFAMTQGTAVILLFFLTIGAGLALPYLLLCLQPAWLKFLPKPGAWMVRFKMLMGFPMLATAVWLLSVTLTHFGKDALLWLGLFLVLLALAAWIYGEFIQKGLARRGLSGAAVFALVAVAFGWILEGKLDWRHPQADVAAGSPAQPRRARDGIAWEAWSPEAVAAARAAGRVVLVDFTADWCLTCKLNKKVALEVPEVRAAITNLNVAAFLGDYTRENPRITEELRRHQRAGVPMVLVFPRDPSQPPRVLPEALTKGGVLDALAWAAAPPVVSRAAAPAR